MFKPVALRSANRWIVKDLADLLKEVNFQRLVLVSKLQKPSFELWSGIVFHRAYSRFFRWFKNSSLVLKVLTSPASACLMLLRTPASNSCRAASLASWMTAFFAAPDMIATPRFKL